MTVASHTRPLDRAGRHRLMALTEYEVLQRYWQALAIDEAHRCVRGPEIGMAMVRGRAGATGNVFNLGEMTVCRATVALADGTLGHGWVRGRERRHAQLIALIDACARLDCHRERIDVELMRPLALEIERHRHDEAAETAATQVDFFTMARGE